MLAAQRTPSGDTLRNCSRKRKAATPRPFTCAQQSPCSDPGLMLSTANAFVATRSAFATLQHPSISHPRPSVHGRIARLAAIPSPVVGAISTQHLHLRLIAERPCRPLRARNPGRSDLSFLPQQPRDEHEQSAPIS